MSSEIGGTVKVLDTSNQEELATINFAIKGIHKDRVQPVGVKLTDDGKYAFVALGPANHIAVVDQKTYEVLEYLLVGRRVWHLALNNDQSQLLTTNGVSSDVSVVDVEKMKVIKTIKVGRYPWGAVIFNQ